MSFHSCERFSKSYTSSRLSIKMNPKQELRSHPNILSRVLLGVCILVCFILFFTFLQIESNARRINKYFTCDSNPMFELQDTSLCKAIAWQHNEERQWRLLKQERSRVLTTTYNLNNLISPLQLWNQYRPSFTCPYPLTRVGKSGDGGKWVCGVDQLHKNSEQFHQPTIVYSFGVNTDSSFEADILNRVDSLIYAYDPTVSSIAAPLSSTDSKVTFNQTALGNVNAGNMRTLKSIMNENGNRFVNILKIDIEGDEYVSLFQVMEDFPSILPFDQLLVEIHTEYPYTPEMAVQLIEMLETRGLRWVKNEVNSYNPNCCEFTFINVNACNLLPCVYAN